MSNPYGKRNIITAGKISSRKPGTFGDEAGKMQYPIIKHTAALSEGSKRSEGLLAAFYDEAALRLKKQMYGRARFPKKGS